MHPATTRKPLTVRDLPRELFRNILDHLGCDSEETLAACTLVCRDWLEVVRQATGSASSYKGPSGSGSANAEMRPSFKTFLRFMACDSTRRPS